MSFTTILSTEVDAKSPIDQALMSNKIKNDFDDHEARLLALEAGGGSSGSTDPKDDPRYGSILGGFMTNEAILWKRRYKYLQTIASNANRQNNVEGFDPEGNDQSRWSGYEENTALGFSSNGESYLGYTIPVDQSKSIQFKIKKGENFFGIASLSSSGISDAVTVEIDGQSVTAAGLYDETGTARANDFNTSTGSVFQKVEWFFGLDGEEHMIKVTNNDSGSNQWFFDFIEVGYASKHGTYAVSKDIKVGAGRVSVRGAALSTAETDLTFDDTVGGGRTDAIKVSNTAVVSILKGIEPAMTQALPEISIPFSSSVTSMLVKNSYFFPSTGFLLVSTPKGAHYMASYTSKTQTLVNQHSFNGLVWQSQPSTDFVPLSNFTSTTAGDATGDLNINLWAGGGHVVSSSNNKLDFKVTLNGTQTTHAATIADGLYSADLVPLGKAIVKAMKAVKPLNNGEYVCEYNAASQKWMIGVKGSEVSELQLLFNSGSNVASSIATTIGFGATDFTGDLSYIAGTESQSLAHKVFRADSNFRGASDPSISYSQGDDQLTNPGYLNIIDQFGFGYMRTMQSEYPYIKLYPDKDACGVSFSFMGYTEGSTIVATIDHGGQLFALQTDVESSSSVARQSILTGFVSFPRGSKVITLYQLNDVQFESGSGTNKVFFLGYRQYFTKPKIEALTTTESVIKSFDIAPKQYFNTAYKAVYSPQSTFDNISTIAYNGTWTLGTSFGSFNDEANYTSSNNDYMDVTFVLAGDGGGIAIRSFRNTTYSKLASAYLIAGGTASETNTLVGNTHHVIGISEIYDEQMFRHVGLPAGTYTLRMKNRHAATFGISSIDVIDTIAPDVGQTTADLANTGQAVSYPVNTVKFPLQRDSYYLVPTYLERTGYGEGITWVDFAASGSTTGGNSFDDAAPVRQHHNYFVSRVLDNSGEFFRGFFFCKSIHTLESSFAGGSPMTVDIDGVAHANNIDQTKQVKGGNPPANHNYYPLFSDHFQRYASSNMSNSTTFLISNTRGFKVGDTVLVGRNATAEIKRVIATVTAGTNITFTEAISGFSNYTTANNAYVKAYGFHALKITTVNGNNVFISAMCFEPLDIQASNDEKRRLSLNRLGEVASITFHGVATGDDLYYPYYADGRQASNLESSISIIGQSSGSASYSLPFDLKNVVISAGTMDIKITSVRRF